jgi:hypothetical protein
MGRPAKNFKPEIVELLGKVPDAQIARMARCSITAVVNRRHKLSIAPYRVTMVIPSPASEASTPTRASVVTTPTITPSTPALTVVSAAAVTTVPAVGVPAIAPVENKLVVTVREALTAAKAGPSGMTIPYELFARLAQEVLA